MLAGENGAFGLGGPISQFGTIYIAYHEGDGAIAKERGRVLLPGDEAMYRSFQKQLRHYSVLRIRAEKDENTFLAQDLLEINAPPTEAEASWLRQAAQPVAFTDPQFGTFTQNKALDFFEGKLDYAGRSIAVDLDKKECIETLRWLCEDLAGVLERGARYAARQLLASGNDWKRDAWEGEEEDFVPLTEKDFMARISLDAISFSQEGSFQLWFNDGDIFWGHVIVVGGNKEAGFTDASMQG